MREFEVGEDFGQGPSETDEGFAIQSVALNGEGKDLITVTNTELANDLEDCVRVYVEGQGYAFNGVINDDDSRCFVSEKEAA